MSSRLYISNCERPGIILQEQRSTYVTQELILSQQAAFRLDDTDLLVADFHVFKVHRKNEKCRWNQCEATIV